jgi:hypothetical protein
MRAHAMDKTQFFSFIKLVFTSCERASIYENAGECNASYTSHFTTRGFMNGLHNEHIDEQRTLSISLLINII